MAAELAPTLDAARWFTCRATHGVNPIKNYLIGLTPCVEAVSYKRRGKGRPATAYLLPNAPADIAPAQPTWRGLIFLQDSPLGCVWSTIYHADDLS